MRRSLRRGLFSSVLVFSYMVCGGTSSSAQEVDERIWSISYWSELVQRGTMAPTTAIPSPASVFTGTAIESQNAVTEDSPDVPIIDTASFTQSENSVFIDPMNSDVVLNSNNSTDFPVSEILGADHFTSPDGGLSWQGSVQGAGGTNRGDPAVAIDLNGRFYVGYIAADRGQGVAVSDDQGATFTHVQVAPKPGPGPNDLADKNHLWVDNSPMSPFEGNLYSAWTDFGGPNDGEIVVSRSTDGGIQWSPGLSISDAVAAGALNQGVNLQTAPNGDVYAVWAIYDDRDPFFGFLGPEVALGFTKSTDGGVSWDPAQRIIQGIKGIRAQFGGALGGEKTMRTASFPSMTVDPDGNIYVVWTNFGVPGVNAGDPDVYLIKSSDGGASWEAPIRVNQDSIGNGKDQWFPWIAADGNGDLVCIFYDSRNFVGNDMAEAFVAVSRNGASTWEDFKVSDVAWSADAFPGFAAGYAGDYIGIDIQDGKVYPVFTDDRTGVPLSYVSPLELRPRAEVLAPVLVSIISSLNASDCDDGVDNDGDGFVDHPDDPGCTGPDDASELGTTQCDDGVDNDGDGAIDLDDPNCSGPNDNRERKKVCGLGFELVLLLPPIAWVWRRQQRDRRR